MEQIRWQEWNDQTLDRAKSEGKPLFVWIDYRGCRACAQMEQESLADPAIAGRIMETMVPVRIDRDEHPDIDRHFQRLFSVANGKEGGWPLTLFLSPELIPLYVAAYLPPVGQGGLNGLPETIDLVMRNWTENHDAFVAKGKALLEELALPERIEATRIDPEALTVTLRRQILEVYDPENGGYGSAPKQLHVSLLKMIPVLLTYREDAELSASYRHTLDKLMTSPIWDAVGKGFYCCTEDDAWQQPRLRKSLAENAIMAIAYFRAAELTGEAAYREQGYRICDWALTKMNGGSEHLFYAGEIDGEMDRRIFFAPNALMAAAMMLAATQEDRYRPDALGILHHLMEEMVHGRHIRHGDVGNTETGYLVDYAALGAALLFAFDLTGNDQFINTAGEFASEALRRFYDRGRWTVGDGAWKDPTVFVDTTLPAPAATMVMVLHRLSILLDKAYAPFVEQTLAVASYELMRRPIAKTAMAEAALRVYGKGE